MRPCQTVLGHFATKGKGAMFTSFARLLCHVSPPIPRRIKSGLIWSVLALALWSSAPLHAEDIRHSYSTYGTPGLIDVPHAYSLPDAELTTSLSHFELNTRAAIAFQVTPRITASFRYAALDGLGGVRDVLFDRSFDVHYRFVDEARLRPAIAVGLRDFIGTGVYSSEYVVASKQLSPKLSATLGLGWGRLGSSGGFSNPLGRLSDRFKTRPASSTQQIGGQLESSQWFRGDAAVFGGFAWQAADRLQVKLEYSSDAYSQEEAGGLIARRSQLNLGLDYRWRPGTRVQAYYLHGQELGVAFHFMNNPRLSAAPSGTHTAPFPVRVREAGPRDLGWVTDADVQARTRDLLAASMRNEGLEIEGFALSGTRAEIQIRNLRYQYSAEAVGRTARVLTRVLPDTVENFVIVPVELGMNTAQITLRRSDVEAFEHHPEGAEQMLARAQIRSAPGTPAPRFDPALYPQFAWSLGPYFRVSLFDPDYPIRTDYGLALTADANLARGLFLTGRLRHRLGGNIGEDIRPSNSVIERVRSDAGLYAQEGITALETLTLAYYFKPGRDLFGRVTMGYLEPHYAGLSTELLWKQGDRRFALGAELNYVRQRAFSQDFGLRDYSVATGHLSAYWDLTNGFHAQLDAGRYLAGDYGVTIAVDRTFRNGWRVGAYATFTDVSFEEFGEGSFDKGLRFTVPLGTFIGGPTRQRYAAVIQPLSRDGGARVHVDGRLYETVRAFHRSGLESSWGRFWR